MTLLPTKPTLMIERPQQEIANATAEIDEAAHAGLVPQLGMMVRALVASPMRNRLVLLAVAVFLVIAVTAYGQIRLNSWNKPFYDALSRRDLREFIVQLGVSGVLAREALAYPSEVGSFEGQKYKAALARLGLESLAPLLDVSRRWDRELNEDEQQRIAFASLVLHAPPWVLIDEVLDSLDDDSSEARHRCVHPGPETHGRHLYRSRRRARPALFPHSASHQRPGHAQAPPQSRGGGAVRDRVT
jgi:ABC-type uncharacterized transport system fused permease/ATPase subunit